MKRIIITLMLIVVLSSFASAGTILSEDFEEDNVSDRWTSATGSRTTSDVQDGSWAYCLSTGQALKNDSLNFPSGIAHVQYYINLTVNTGEYANPSTWYFRGSGSDRTVHEGKSAGNLIEHYASGSTWTDVPNSDFRGQWTKVDIIYHESNGTVEYIINDAGEYSNPGTSTGAVDSLWFNTQGSSTTYCLDSIQICDNECDSVSASPPTILTYDCTSCTTDGTPTLQPFTTEDTTPTFNITTDKDALCAIGTVNQNYTDLINSNSERNCTSGGGSKSLICTLPVSDGIRVNETDHVYIGCQAVSDGLENISSTSGSMQMDITTSQTGVIGGLAIESGINASAIFPDAIVYTDQQVYIRDLDNNQTLATYERVATWNLKVWVFNFIKSTETAIQNLFNVTPSIYTAEYDNTMTYRDINNSVRDLINDTYS